MNVQKTRNCLFLIISFCLLSGFSLKAEAVQGLVLDQNSKKPIPEAKIKYKLTSENTFIQGTTADQEGQFIFSVNAIQERIYQIRIEKEGYFAREEELILGGIKKTTEKTFILEKQMEQVIQLEHKNYSDVLDHLHREIRYPIQVDPLPGKRIKVIGKDVQVEEATRLIREFDTAPRQIILQVMLITANGGERKKVEYDPKVKNIIKQLTSLFKFNYYWVVGQAEMVGMENERLSIMSENKTSAFHVDTMLKYQNDVVKLERLKIVVAKPGKGEIVTTVNIRNGETVILGASSGQHEGEAMITAVTAKVVE